MDNQPKFEFPKPPDPNTEEGKKQIETLARLTTAIGTLFLTFSGVEVSLFAFLGSLWPVPLPVAKAVYGDMRVEAAINTIRRLIEARKQIFPETEVEKGIARWTDYALTQLAIINGVRNHIAHHGFGNTENIQKGILTNTMRARGTPKEIAASPDDIEAMNGDLAGILGIIATIGMIATIPPHVATTHPMPKSSFDLIAQTVKQSPWRYKSPLQGGSGGKSQGKAQEPPPPQKSSPV